jgi:hypothetical protein
VRMNTWRMIITKIRDSISMVKSLPMRLTRMRLQWGSALCKIQMTKGSCRQTMTIRQTRWAISDVLKTRLCLSKKINWFVIIYKLIIPFILIKYSKSFSLFGLRLQLGMKTLEKI